MSENGHYDDERLEQVLKLLKDVDTQTRELRSESTMILKSIANDCRLMAQNTQATATTNAAIATTLDQLQENNNAQVQIIAGKWQVPMPVFLVVAAVFAVWMVAEKASQTKTEVKITPSEFSVGHDDRRDSKTSP